MLHKKRCWAYRLSTRGMEHGAAIPSVGMPMGWTTGIRYPRRKRYDYISTASRPALGPAQPHGALSPGAKTATSISCLYWRYIIHSDALKDVTSTIMGIIIRPVFNLKTRRFGDWILSPSSGSIYSDRPNKIQVRIKTLASSTGPTWDRTQSPKRRNRRKDDG
jgi:hypothetical protein